MTEGLLTLLSLSVSGTLLLFLILLCRPVLQKYLSHTWQYYIWLAVILRLLLPITAPVNLVGGLMRPAEALLRKEAAVEQTADSAAGQGALPETEDGETAAKGNGREFVPDGEMIRDRAVRKPAGAMPSGPDTAAMILAVLWLLGAVLLFGKKLASWKRFRKEMERTWRPAEDDRLSGILREQKERLGIRKPVPVYINPGVSSPMLAGLFRPCLVLPEENLHQGRLKYTLKHELIHFKRHDLAYKWLIQLCLCLHWFNPFLKKLEKEAEKACELSCDEAVMKDLDAAGRRAYGDTLLEAMFPSGNRKAPAVMLLEEKKQLKERLGAIMDYQKMTGRKRFLGGFMAVMIGVCAVSAGAYASPAITSPDSARGAAAPGTAGKMQDADSRTVGQNTEGDGGETDSPVEDSKTADWKKKYMPYLQKSYYQYPYILEIGWNIPRQKTGEFPYSRVIQLTEEKSVTCYFSETVKQYMDHDSLLQALAAVYPKLEKIAERSNLPLETPYLTNVTDITGRTVKELAAESYEEEELPIFSAVFPELEDSEKSEFLSRMYQEGEVAFFAASLGDADRETIRGFNRRSWEDRATNFFSITLEWMEEEEIAELARQAYREGEKGMFAVIAEGGDLPETARRQLLEQARGERWGSFYITLLEEE